MKLEILILILIEFVGIINSSWWFLGLKVTENNTSKSINNNNNNEITNKNNNNNNNDKNFSGQNLFELSKLRMRIRSYENNNKNNHNNQQSSNTNSPSVGLQKYCANVRIFESATQRQICFKHDKLIGAVARAAKRAIDECQRLFAFRRWNCTIVNRPSVFGSLVQTTFIYAINSAAAMYEITKACTRGELKGCTCNRKLKFDDSTSQVAPLRKQILSDQQQNVGKYEWGGCSENVIFGHKLSKVFVDSKEDAPRRSGISSHSHIEAKLIHLHNNEVGRRVILKNMKQVCKCHGVSGSCSVKVCWKVMPEFSEIGTKLAEKYEQALQLDTAATSRLRIRKMLLIRHDHRRHRSAMSPDELVYVDKSPNYCHRSRRFDTPGTRGRVCGHLALRDHEDDDMEKSSKRNTNSTMVNNCRHLCCGRGYRVKLSVTEQSCDCQFQWCCSVKCRMCKTKVIEYICN